MTARELMTLALRVLGVWVLLQILPTVPWLVSTILRGSVVAGVQPTNPTSAWGWVSFIAMALTLQIALGAGLLCAAPRIARAFYPPTDQDVARISFDTVTSQDVYRIAAFLLGIYVLIQGASYGLRTIADLMQGRSLSIFSGGTLYSAVQAGVYLAAGLGLVFGARGLGELLGRLRPDTEGVPAQQFNLRVLLVLVLLYIGAVALLSLLRTI